MNIDVGREALLLLVDSRADISLIKSERLVGTTEFEPEERVRMKSVDGSIIETHGSVKATIVEGKLQIPFSFQLVSKQVDLVGDGILGRDFLQQMQTQICYRTKTITFKYEGVTVTKPLRNKLMGDEPTDLELREGRTKLLPRSEMIVRLPVKGENSRVEGVIDRREIVPGVYLAGSIVKVVNGYALTSVLNTTEEEVELGEPTVQITELETAGSIPEGPESSDRARDERVLSKLRLDHLSKEERKSLEEVCFEYQDVFFLPGIA